MTITQCLKHWMLFNFLQGLEWLILPFVPLVISKQLDFKQRRIKDWRGFPFFFSFGGKCALPFSKWDLGIQMFFSHQHKYIAKCFSPNECKTEIKDWLNCWRIFSLYFQQYFFQYFTTLKYLRMTLFLLLLSSMSLSFKKIHAPFFNV